MAEIKYIVSLYRSAKTHIPTYHQFWAAPETLQFEIKQEDAAMRRQWALADCIDTQVFDDYQSSMSYIYDLYTLYKGQIGCF